MANDNITSLIDDLSSGLQPVRPLHHPVVRILPWIVLAVAYVTGLSHFLGLRFDLIEKMGHSAFLFEMGLVFSIAVTAAFATGWLAIPDMREQKGVLAIPTALFSVFIFWLVVQTYVEGLHMPATINWNHCVEDALLMGAFPVAALVFFSRRGATTRPGWMAFMSILAVGALGWIGLRFICAVDVVGHTGLYHFIPFVFVGGLLGALARKVYRW